MIANVIQYGNLLVIRDQTGNQIGSISLNGGEVLGHSSKFVLVRYGNNCITMNENSQQLGMTPIPSGYRIQGITDSGFSARTGNVIEVYDQYCNHIDHYSL